MRFARLTLSVDAQSSRPTAPSTLSLGRYRGHDVSAGVISLPSVIESGNRGHQAYADLGGGRPCRRRIRAADRAWRTWARLRGVGTPDARTVEVLDILGGMWQLGQPREVQERSGRHSDELDGAPESPAIVRGDRSTHRSDATPHLGVLDNELISCLARLRRGAAGERQHASLASNVPASDGSVSSVPPSSQAYVPSSANPTSVNVPRISQNAAHDGAPGRNERLGALMRFKLSSIVGGQARPLLRLPDRLRKTVVLLDEEAQKPSSRRPDCQTMRASGQPSTLYCTLMRWSVNSYRPIACGPFAKFPTPSQAQLPSALNRTSASAPSSSQIPGRSVSTGGGAGERGDGVVTKVGDRGGVVAPSSVPAGEGWSVGLLPLPAQPASTRTIHMAKRRRACTRPICVTLRLGRSSRLDQACGDCPRPNRSMSSPIVNCP